MKGPAADQINDAASDCWTDASSAADSAAAASRASGRRRRRNKGGNGGGRWGTLAALSSSLPRSRKEVLDVFTLSRTNQILQVQIWLKNDSAFIKTKNGVN